jgi:hypothetical protein
MSKYNTSVRICEEEFAGFSKKMTSGFCKTDTRFIEQMLVGINKSESVLLSEIARNSEKKVGVRKTIQRFSRKLCSFDNKKFEQNRIELVRELLPEHKLYIVDDSEIVKPSAQKMEGLGWVADGSDKHKVKRGYYLNEIVAIDKNKQPVSVSSKLYSAEEKGFESANKITQSSILQVIKTTGKGVFVFDRGFDDVKLHNFLVNNKQQYIVRAKSTRNVVCCDAEYNIDTFARMLKGKFAFSIKFQQGTKEHLKASYKEVYLPKMPHTPLNFVVVYGFSKDPNEPFYLLTNLPIKDKDSCLKVVGVYLTRWKIEEYFKFKKQAYRFESMRVRTLTALKNLNLFLTTTITFLAMLGNTTLQKNLIFLARPTTHKVTFVYYRLLAGLRILLQKTLLKLAKPNKKSDRIIPKQRDFFHYLRYVKNRAI